MNIMQWAIRHHVSMVALAELNTVFGLNGTDDVTAVSGKSEAAVQSEVRVEAGKKGMRLFRNNVGAGYMEDGSFIRFGLANDSTAVNKVIKSADLIGIRPVLIGPQHVGSTIGQFVSREIKAPGWRYAGTEREVAQAAWAQLIVAHGGDAMFATSAGTL